MKYNSSALHISDLKTAEEIIMKINNLSPEGAIAKLQQDYNNMSMTEMFSDIALKAKEYYLSMHKEAIFFASDGRYKTHLIIDGDRRVIPSIKREKLENIIVNHYKEKESVHSIASMKEEFLEDRKKYVRICSVARDESSYRRFFDGSSMIYKDIRNITNKELSDYRIKTIIRLKLDKKGTQRFQSLLNAVWDYAVSAGYTDINTARNLRPLGRSFFTPNQKLDLTEINEKFRDLPYEINEQPEEDEEDNGPQYYNAEEQCRLIETCHLLFLQRQNTAYLAIIMCFCLGLRIGELVALKTSDFYFKNGVVHIRRREVTSIDQASGKKCCRISTRLKNEASKRDLPISPTCRKVFDMIVSFNEHRQIESDFLFISVQNKERMHSGSVDEALDRANDKARLEQRSLHKIRKTYLSRLNMSQKFTLERIRELAGHSRNSMTLYTNYFYTIESLEGITGCSTVEDVVEYKMPNL